MLRLLADDLPNHDVADALSISPGTVGKHVENVIAKLETDRPAAAVGYGLWHGVIGPLPQHRSPRPGVQLGLTLLG